VPGIVIVGAGQAGIEAACVLREAGYARSVTVLGEERGTPYQRPPLSKDLSAGGELPLLPLRAPRALAELGVTLIEGARATRLLRGERLVEYTAADGRPHRLEYEHLILATGGTARGAGPGGAQLPGEDAAGVHRLRTREDAQALASALRTARSVAVIGGGVIGLEFASISAAAGVPTTVLERGQRILRRFVGGESAAWLHGRHEDRGVRILRQATVEGFERTEDGAVAAVLLANGGRLEADLVLVGTGVTPAVFLAADAGLACAGGITVDARLRTADPRISAIGDCASFVSPHAPAPLRLESVQNATDQARFLGRALAAELAAPADLAGRADAAEPGGAPAPAQQNYVDLPWFWSVQAGVKVQVAGLATDAGASVVIGDPSAGKFSVLRFAGERLVCVESIGRPADHLAARRLLAAGDGPTLAEARAGRIESLKSWNAVVPV
jgi:3-phenylpropionate/trans-cinnamate dioxygenase ferredoxin reductase component